MQKVIVVIVVSSLLAAGCDPLGTNADAQERERAERLERERAAAECESLRAGLKTLVSGKQALYESEIKKHEASAVKLRADAGRLTTTLSAIMDGVDDKGVPLKYESKILRILKDETVNALATEYLASNYALVVPEYTERVRDALAKERRYQRALANSDEVYESAIKESRQWAKATQEQREAEIARLEKEIVSIERKRNAVREEWKNLTRHTMQGNVRLERERMEKGMALGNRIDDLEREIVKKRFQMDMLKHPEKASVYESRAMARIHEAQRTAESNRRDRQSEIDRQIKPEKSVADVVSEYEAKTVGRLRGVLTARVLEDERTVEGMRKKLLQLRDAALSIPVLSREELVALKRKLMAE